MKRIIKKSNRKGFTLVETLLATFILVVVSTMLVNGFIATMGFSYQTSVYSKSGSNNYAACMNKVAQWNTLTDCGDGGREEKGKAYYTANGNTHKKLSFKNTPSGTKLEQLYVGIEAKTDLSETVPHTLPFGNAAYAPKDGTAAHGGAGSDQLADNRKAIVYYPEYWKGKNSSSFKKIIVMGDYSQSPVQYYWVVSPSGGTNEKEDLSGLGTDDIIGKLGDTHKSYEQ